MLQGAPPASADTFYTAMEMPEALRRQFEPAAQEVMVWPENCPALQVFAALQTQWRTGYAGPTGLDYAVLPAVMDLQQIDHAARPGLFADLRTMEIEALKVFSDERKQHKDRH